MRIFLSCLQSKVKHPIPAYQFWEVYFKNGIEEAGHDWLDSEEVDWAEGLVHLDEESLIQWRDRTWSIVVSTIKKKHKENPIHLFLSYLFPKQVNPDAIREIQDLGIPCVNFYCDNVRDFVKIPKAFYCFDLNWVPEYKALKMYESAGLKYIFAPMPVWIPLKLRNSDHIEKYGVSFIGSRDTQREALLSEVLRSNVRLEIRGVGWSHDESFSFKSDVGVFNLQKTATNQLEFIRSQGMLAWLRKISARSLPSIADEIFVGFVKRQPDAEEYPLIIQQSIVTLGINRYPSYRHPFYNPDKYSRMRDIEAPMMGACYLTEWTEGLEQLYEIGKEIETYSSAEEMIAKISMLCADTRKRKEMRRLAQKRSLQEHTFTNSITRISQILEC